MWLVNCTDYVGFIKKVMKQMQQQQYTPMKKMEVDMRPLDAEEEKAKEGLDRLSIFDLCCSQFSKPMLQQHANTVVGNVK